MDINASVADLPQIGPVYRQKLEKLNIKSIADFFYHIPSRYLDFSHIIPIKMIRAGDLVTVQGELVFLKNQYTKSGRKIQLGEVKDKSGSIYVVWFNQPFLIRTLYPGDTISLAGKADWFGHKIALISPEHERRESLIHTGRIVPIYHETAGITSKWLRSRIKFVFDQYYDQIKDDYSSKFIRHFGLQPLNTALKAVHFPKNMGEIQRGIARLAFDELFTLELASLKRKNEWLKNHPAFKLTVSRKNINKFVQKLPFRLTKAQEKATREITADLGANKPMNRLLEGDVGSGKTVVAAIAALVALDNRTKTVFMAPTQILAKQHFLTFSKLFAEYKPKIALVTADSKIGEYQKADIIIGTHALLSQSKNFKKVALVIIDEQHKFGVGQRQKLITKSKKGGIAPHLLSMTATPIPRTVALCAYGDYDLSVLDELPRERILPSTWIVQPEKREAAYQWIKDQISQNKTQVFVICPLIDKSNNEILSEVKAVEPEYRSLRRIFKQFKVAMIHGKIKDKNQTIEQFHSGKIDILVATPVVEVGIDIPGANIILIEAADRFGLAQLHQLRGRVGRSNQKSYCLLFSDSDSSKALSRLTILKKELSGFRLAEADLELRGPGEIYGLRQSGLPELKIASWRNRDLIKKARIAAETIIGK